MIRQDGSVTTLREAHEAHRKPIEQLGRDAGCPKWADPYKFQLYMETAASDSPLAEGLSVILTLLTCVAVPIVLCLINPFLIAVIVSYTIIIYGFHKLNCWFKQEASKPKRDHRT